MKRHNTTSALMAGTQNVMKGNITISTFAKHCLTIAALLIAVCNNVQAADYVFMSGSNYIIIDNSGAITTTTTFNPSTCLWSGTSGGAFTNNGKTLKYSQTYSESGGLGTTTRTYNPPVLSTNTSEKTVEIDISSEGVISFQAPVTGSRFITWNIEDGTWYIQNNNGSIVASTTSNANNNIKAYQVTITDASDFTFNISSPTAGAYIGQVNGTMTISAQASGNFRPAYYSFNNRYYYSTDGGETYTSNTNAPSQVSNYNYEYEIVSGGGNASISGNTVTYTKDAGHDVDVVVRVTANPQGYDDVKKTAECTFTLYSATVTAPTITPGPDLNQYTITGPANSTIKYTIDGTDIDASGSNGTTYSEPITITTPNTTIKAKAVREGKVSQQTAYTVANVTLMPPTITINDAGSVTITNTNGSVGTIYYTTDGTEPSASSTQYNGIFTVNNMQTVKAIVAGGTGYISMSIAEKQYKIESGISGGTVVLNDYEDHNWSYYKGLDYTITNPDGTTISYKDKYRYSIYSPDPRNVKITYRGYDTETGTIDLGGTTKVNISTLNNNTAPHVSNVEGEGQNTFVYYKTLEKFVIGFFEQHQTDGDYDGTPANPNNTAEQYPYTVISNPFSVRPSTGTGDSKTYYGFAGWKIISGGDKILEYGNNDVIPLDAIIHFTGMESGYTPNCTSADVVLEATWTQATVWSGNAAHSFTGKTYETNFIVASGNMGGDNNTITQNSPCTITALYPDGSGTDNSGTFTLNNLTVGANHVKVEYIRHGGGTFNANGNNLTLGRGITSSNNNGNTAQGNVYNSNSDIDCVNTVKVESGYYTGCRPLGSAISSGKDLNAYIIFGCDYDRAKADYFSTTANGYNTKLRISSLGWSQMSAHNRTNGQLYLRTLFKSGIVEGAFYSHKSSTTGQRFITMEGGYVQGDFTGGSENELTQHDARSLTFRGKGNFRMDGRVAGGSTQNDCSGDRCIALTGGTVAGWIAAGSNSRQTTGGVTTGETFVYIGGNAQIDSKGNQKLYNTSSGGVVYGAGCGINHNSTSGAVTKGSNVILADNAYVERGVYGGGAMGRINEGQSSNIFVLGGHVGTGVGTITDSANPEGQQNVTVSMTGVFGGACNVGGGYSNIYMNGGVVEGGVFGGSNITGTMDNNVKIQIDGGQVGTSTKTANVHGGGYGQPTRVTGNVDVTLGTLNSSTGETTGNAVIYGDVYGGSALGHVNGEAVSTTKHTNVTLNAGTINGSLYGGALGSDDVAANVYGPVQVTVNGGTVNTTTANGSGAVYGCNNINGAPQSTVKVDIYGTDPAPSENAYALDAVYGGGNMAHYSAGTPQVTVHNCDNSIGTVYGGGNAADITNGGTVVTIYGGNVIGKVFGGGNGEREGTKADISGGTNVTIHGGTILDVYGGSNTRGTIGGTINVTVNELAETTGQDACPININNVFGGGNLAPSAAAKMTIGCATHVGAVYGGANQANITSGNIDLVISGGNIDNVFGGNNVSGTISGTIKVTVNEDKTKYPCGVNVGNVYGAGNQAAYTNTGAYPAVNILKGNVTGDVFGGGLGETATVTSNPAVLINGGTVQGNVFGGGSEANTVGNPVVTMQSGYVGTALYGGGALANVTGNTTVSLTGGTVNDVYGGGLGRLAGEGVAAVAAIVTGNTNVTLNGSVVTGSIFGCNNVNGTPKGHAKVTVTKTTAQPGAATDAYHVAAVYGGGNQAAYLPNTPSAKISEDDAKAFAYSEVLVEGCDNSIKYVYGGGNAASTPATKVTIEGGTIFNVFGGGNGKTEEGAATENPGADIGYKDFVKDDDHAYGEGTTTVNIYGGVITSVFGGSNTKGNIRVASNVNLDDQGVCDFQIGDVYGAGNEAEMYGDGHLIIGCIPGLREIYGGAKNADIHGDVTLTIANGEFEKVFGGNNLGGNIAGSVTVNIEETGCRPVIIGELYGGGNLAAYTAPIADKYGDNKGKYPIVNVRSCTSIGTVFGGGLGMTTEKLNALTATEMKAEAKKHGKTDTELEALSEDELKALVLPYYKAKGVIKGSPQVNIGLIEGEFAYGGTYGTETFPAISNRWGNKLGTIETVFGGGNAADVEGDTYVNIGTMATINLVSGEDHSDKQVKGVNISGNVYGGGNQANVTGKTFVTVGRKKE